MKDTTMTIRLAQADKDKLRELAAKKDVPVAQIIREAIKECLNKEGK